MSIRTSVLVLYRLRFALLLAPTLGLACAEGENGPVSGATGNGASAGKSSLGAGGSATGGSVSGGASSGGSGVSGSGGATGAGGSPLGGSSGSAGKAGGGTGGSGGGGGASGSAGSGGVPQSVIDNASVVLYYQTDKTSASSTVIFLKMFIENKSADPLSMASVKVRYWFTSEAASPVLKSFYQGGNIAGQSQTFTSDGDDSYAEVYFSGNSIALGADLNASEFQLQIEGGTFDQSNDYSWQPAYTARQPHDKITVYLSGTLIWGCEPTGACAGDGSGGGSGLGGGGGQGGA